MSSGTDPGSPTNDPGDEQATPPVGEGPLGRSSMIWLGVALLVFIVVAVGWTLLR